MRIIGGQLGEKIEIWKRARGRMQEDSTPSAVDLSIRNGKVKPKPFHVTKSVCLALNYGLQTPVSVIVAHILFGAILGALYDFR